MPEFNDFVDAYRDTIDQGMTHFGDPCIHCGVPHDDVEVGACSGDRNKGAPIVYCILRQGWENNGGASTVLNKMSTGEYMVEGRHTYEMEYYKSAKVLAPHEFRQRYPDAPRF